MMDKQILLDLLINILKSQGYDTTPEIDLPGIDLVVENDGEITCIQYGLVENDLRYFADIVQGSYGALFISDEISEWMTFFADQYGIRTWDRAELEIRIGKAILAEAEGIRYDFLEGQKNLEDQKKMPDTTEIVSDSHDMLQLRCAPIRVDEKRAMATAKGFVSGITNIVIEFVPFWNYKYVVDTYQQYKMKTVHISSEDSSAINALNKQKHEYLREIHDQISIPSQNYEIKSAVLTKDEVENEILSDAIASNTKTIAFTSTSGDAIITEHKTVKPRSKDINLDVELVYLPVWEVKGANHNIMIDAYTGSVMTEPVDDDVEFL